MTRKSAPPMLVDEKDSSAAVALVISRIASVVGLLVAVGAGTLLLIASFETGATAPSHETPATRSLSLDDLAR